MYTARRLLDRSSHLHVRWCEQGPNIYQTLCVNHQKLPVLSHPTLHINLLGTIIQFKAMYDDRKRDLVREMRLVAGLCSVVLSHTDLCAQHACVQAPLSLAQLVHLPCLTATHYTHHQKQIVEGEWFDDPTKPHNRRHKTQNQEMLGYYLGVWGIRTVAFMQFFGWFGTGAKQILSSSSLFYSIDQSWSMRWVGLRCV